MHSRGFLVGLMLINYYFLVVVKESRSASARVESRLLVSCGLPICAGGVYGSVRMITSVGGWSRGVAILVLGF